MGSRIEIRIPENIKQIWTEQAEEQGYPSISYMIEIAVNLLLEHKDLSDNQKDILKLRQQQKDRQNLSYLIKQNLSEGFFVDRVVQTLKKYLNKQDYTDETYIIEYLTMCIKQAQQYPNPIILIKNLLRFTVTKEWNAGVTLLKRELRRLKVSETEIEEATKPKKPVQKCTDNLRGIVHTPHTTPFKNE